MSVLLERIGSEGELNRKQNGEEECWGPAEEGYGEVGSPHDEAPGSCRLKGLESTSENRASVLSRSQQQAVHTPLQNGDISPNLPVPQPGSTDRVTGISQWWSGGGGGTGANLQKTNHED